MIDQEVQTIELAPVAAKNQLAKRAWDGLPLERRHRNNLEILRDAATADPAHFLSICRTENLPVDLSIVVNNHHETHNHYHQQPQGDSLTRSDMAAILEAMRSQQPQQPGMTAEDVRAIVQSVQPRNNGITREELMMAMQYMQPQPQQYYPEPAYYQQPYQQQPIVFNPHIEVNATSHSEQDYGGGGGRVLACFVILLCFVLGISAGGR